jgi:hypothetical protein
MLRALFGVCTLTILAACSTAPQAAMDSPKESQVSLIKQGMSQAEVGAILGDFQREDFDPSDGSLSCRSYAYGVPPHRKYIHVQYYYELVDGADDGHIGLCIYGGDIVR